MNKIFYRFLSNFLGDWQYDALYSLYVCQCPFDVYVEYLNRFVSRFFIILHQNLKKKNIFFRFFLGEDLFSAQKCMEAQNGPSNGYIFSNRDSWAEYIKDYYLRNNCYTCIFLLHFQDQTTASLHKDIISGLADFYFKVKVKYDQRAEFYIYNWWLVFYYPFTFNYHTERKSISLLYGKCISFNYWFTLMLSWSVIMDCPLIKTISHYHLSI